MPTFHERALAWAAVAVVVSMTTAGCFFFSEPQPGWRAWVYRGSADPEGQMNVPEGFEMDFNATWHEPFSEVRGAYEGTVRGERPFTVVLESPQPFEADFTMSGAVEEVEAEPPFLPSLLVECLKETNESIREAGAVSIHVVRTPGRCAFHVNLTGNVSEPGGFEITWGVQNTAEMLERVRFIVAFGDAPGT